MSLTSYFKQVSQKNRNELRRIIEAEAIAYAVAGIDNNEIDRINILKASFKAMHEALDKLKIKPQLLLIDGNRFPRYKKIPHQTIIEGDCKYMSIAAASVLAKTYRDEWMEKMHKKFPAYHWLDNKGYGTEKHRNAILEFGQTSLHRKSFVIKELSAPTIKRN